MAFVFDEGDDCAFLEHVIDDEPGWSPDITSLAEGFSEKSEPNGQSSSGAQASGDGLTKLEKHREGSTVRLSPVGGM